MNTATLTAREEVSRVDVLELLSESESRTYQRIPDIVGYVASDDFHDDLAEEIFFGRTAPQINVPEWSHFPEVPEEIPQRIAGQARLTAEEEQALFLRYNYAKYRLSGLVKAQQRHPTLGRARQMIMWYDRAMKCRSDIVGANMALVLAMARRTRIPNVDFTEMVSEGNMALLRAVEKFDASRGFKFSTYACRAILKSFNRLATNTNRYRQRFPTEYDPEMDRSDYDVKKHDMQVEDSVDALRDIIARNLARLSDVERKIITERFAVGSGGKKRTLAEVGQIVGLTNERVRQIQNLALAKLREKLDEDYLVA